MTGTIKSNPFVNRVKNGDKKALFAEVAFSHDGEVRTLQIFPGIGEDSWPCKGDIVVVEKSHGVWYIAGVWDGKEPEQKPGERSLYGRDGDGKITSKLSMLNGGKIEVTAEKDFSADIKGKYFFGNAAMNIQKLLLDLVDEIKKIQTFGYPALHNIHPQTVQSLEAYKNKIKDLFKEGA